MEAFLRSVRRLNLHHRVLWQRTRSERTLVCEQAEEAVRLLKQASSDAREIEVHRVGERRYVLRVRD